MDLINHLLGLRLLQVVDLAPDTHAPRMVRMHRLVAELVRERCAPPAVATQQEALTELVKERSAALENTISWKDARWEFAPFEALAWLWAEPAPPAPGSQTGSADSPQQMPPGSSAMPACAATTSPNGPSPCR